MRLGNVDVCDECGAGVTPHTRDCSRGAELAVVGKQKAATINGLSHEVVVLVTHEDDGTDTVETTHGIIRGVRPQYLIHIGDVVDDVRIDVAIQLRGEITSVRNSISFDGTLLDEE